MELTTAAGIAGGETTGPEENEEQNGQQLTSDSGQVEKGSGYGDPGESSGETAAADDGSSISNTSGPEEDRAAALPGTTASETVSENDSKNAGAGIDYGGTGDDAGAITESTDGEPDHSGE